MLRRELVWAMLLAVLPGLLWLASPTSSLAQATEVDARQSRGVSVPSAYQLADLDAVNLFNGNLTLAIPLGQEYPVGERLSYRFTLRTNSNVWHFEQIHQSSTDTDETIAEPDTLFSNAGLGWQLSFGRLYAPFTPDLNDSAVWALLEGDGSRRRFTSASLHESQDPTGATVTYTRDGSYLRMTKLANGDREVEARDGTVRVFRTGTGVITQIRDRFGNALNFDYSVANTWTLTDTLGRTHYIRFHNTGVEFNHIREVDLEGFGGVRARYLFNYDTPTIERHSKHSASEDEQGDPISSSVTVPLLQSVTLPDLSQFRVTYILVRGERTVYEEPGMVRSLVLPTQGKYEWEYWLYIFPVEQPSDPNAPPQPQGPFNNSEGVRFKRVFDRGGALLGFWSYLRSDRPSTQPAAPPITEAGAWEVRTWVTDPYGHETVHYFQNRPGVFGYGFPFTTLLTDATGTRLLSSESFQGSATATSPIRLRSEYLRYESDPLTVEGNARIASRRTVYHDDGDRVADVAFSDFDGYGHYRSQATAGTFDSGNVRTTITNYNPSRGTLGQAGFSSWPTTEPWVLNTFTEQRVTEGVRTEIRQTSFDTSTGVLLSERLLAGAIPVASDIVRTYQYDASGFRTREEHTGGDGGNGLYVFRHSPQHGVRAKTEVLDGTRVLLTTLDQDIDRSTGLPSVQRDSAGLATTFAYDALGRVVREEPPDEAPVATLFEKAALNPAKITVTREDPALPGVELQRAAFELDGLGRLAKERVRLPGGVFNQRLTEYDPAGNKGRVSELQASGTSGTSLRWTVFGYDPFGRVGFIGAPDGHSISIQYAGVRTLTRNVNGVATSTAGTEQTATTVETYDRQGRLIEVEQASGPAGELVSTQYSYDPADRLREVRMLGVEATQVRTFSYDGRGFLLSETHPEIDGAVLYSGYDSLGNVGRKRSGQKAGGGYHTDLSYTYDPAGRLSRVSETGGRLFKELFYATSNGVGDSRQGKLVQAKRHNYVPDLANLGTDLHRVVTETLIYGGPGGRLSEKRIRGTDPSGAAAASFSQSYTFDDLGNVLDEIYPRCISPRCERYGPPRVISYQYDQGMLTGIPGWVDSITYHRNGLVSQIRHQNDMIDTWTNDPDSMARPRAISFSGRSSLNLGTYLYDGAGNIKSMGPRLFAYDRVSRLTEANLQPDAQAQTYTFDSFGNLNSITTTDSTDPLNPITTPRPIGVSTTSNRLTGASYDGSGNVTSLFTLSSFTYDPFNRVTHLVGTGVNKSFLYDTSDNRVAILDHQAQTEEWHLRGLHDKVVRSFLSSPEGWSWKQDWVYRDGQLVGSTAPAKWREYHLDHLGSPRLVTGPIGLKVAEYHPFPFGEMASENGPGVAERENLFRYTGHERDVNCESGGCDPEGQDDLDYMLARFYSPVVGRFLGVDPADVSNFGFPQVWNRYSYTLGNPLKYTDPSGLAAILARNQDGYFFARDDNDDGVPDDEDQLKIKSITVNLTTAEATLFFEDTEDIFVTPVAVSNPSNSSEPDAGTTYYLAWWEDDKTSNLYENTQVGWSKDPSNPFGPHMAVLSLTRTGYKNPKDTHLHGTSGPLVQHDSTQYLGYRGGGRPELRKFTHGCTRCNNTVISALREHAPIGIPVRFVK